MPHSVQSTGIITRTASIAAVLVASWIGAGTTTVQAGQLTLKFTNASKTKISIKVDKIGYREDIDIGKSVTVPSTKLQNVDPKDQGIDWDAHQGRFEERSAGSRQTPYARAERSSSIAREQRSSM